jgi:hypothetical protein
MLNQNQNLNLSSNNNSNLYYSKLNEYMVQAPGRMYVFEITKFCGYGSFVFMYRNETLADLYNRVSHHFDCKTINGMYIDKLEVVLTINSNDDNSDYNSNDNININDNNINDNNINDNNINDNNINSNDNCCIHKGNLIQVPLSGLTTISEFIFHNISPETRNLRPIYDLPAPVVYRIYLDDGHCHC